MLPRAIAIFLSLFLHGALAFAMWPRLQQQQLEVLDFGSGQDIELAPQGMIIGNVTNRGDDIQSLKVQDVVPVNQHQPATERTTAARPKQLHDILGRSERSSSDQIAAAREQKPKPQPPVAMPAKQLHVVGANEKRSTEPIAAIHEERPISEVAAHMPQHEVHDVFGDSDVKSKKQIAAIHAQQPAQQPAVIEPSKQLRAVPDTLENKGTPKAVAIHAQKPPPLRPATPPAERLRDVVAEKTPAEPESVKATATPWPDQRKEPTSGKSGKLPPPDELKELATEQVEPPSPPKPIETASPPRPIKEPMPDPAEVETVPEQVAIVTEQSSGEIKLGGNAQIVGRYLSKINERVQRSKVNPHTRLTGTVVLRYRVGVDGALLSKDVAVSSGYSALDNAAIATLNLAAPFPPIPPEISLTPMTFSQPFSFIVR